MTDLERFVRRLVELLELHDPDGVHRPVAVAELRGQVVPYRANRSALGVVSEEDYDLLVLRLLAEEGGFVRTNPPAAAARARDEVASPNPNLDLVEELADATVQIGAAALARIAELGDLPPWASQPIVSDLPFISIEPLVAEAPPPGVVVQPAPPEPPPPPPPIIEMRQFEALEPAAPPAEAPELSTPSTDNCPRCTAALPTGREVPFCPFCGLRIGARRCASCGAELEAGWRHCITCGQIAPPPVA